MQPGDTMWSIATKFGTTPQAIMQRNGITNPAMIYVGKTLIIPVPSTPGPYPTPTPTNLANRVDRLERRLNRLERRVSRIEGRVRSED